MRSVVSAIAYNTYYAKLSALFCCILCPSFYDEITYENNKYRLTHGFRRYTGNIPEVLQYRTRAVLISTEGISLYAF